MLKFPTFPMRQVHLDFHTSPAIPDVGADWDAEHFIEILRGAHVNSITVFARCHHGMNYYPTKVGPVHLSSHDFTPPQAEAAGYPAITRREDVVYIYGPIFAAYQKHGNLTFRALVGRCLDLLLPERIVETDAPATAEVSLMRQGNRDVVHVVNYHAVRRAPAHVEALEEPVPLRDVTLRLRRTAPTTSVKLVRTNSSLSFDAVDGTISVTVPRIDAHELIIFEGDG